MSTRIITNQQFSDGTTIDGNRLEDALQDVERYVNKVPSQMVRRRYTQSQIVSGWSPITGVNGTYTNQHPWMNSLNTGLGPTAVKNQYRLKGYDRPEADLIDKQYIWNQAFSPNRSIVIHALDLFLAQDPGATPVYVMPGGYPYPNFEPPKVTDIEIHITIDSPYVPEERSQNDMEIHKRDFSSSAWVFRGNPAASFAPINDMLPLANGGGLAGFSVNLNNLNIPVYPYARVRFAIIIPKYQAGAPGEANWTSSPWRTSVISQTLTILEPNDHD